MPESVRMFKLTRSHKGKPLFKMIDAKENIIKNNKKGYQKIVKLLERLDLDRPLILKEKLDIIWNEKKCEPINIQDISCRADSINQSTLMESPTS